MTELLRRFIKAERMGNWDLHLKTLSDMLPYFAASGHNLYTKSAYLYLQNMSTLEQDHPDVFQYFQNGYHVIRRTDRYWAGISTDLAIEQVLMRSVKTSGGLTRGRGMSEIQRAVWLLSTPACAEINRAMQEFTGVTYIASEQHKDSSPARIDRDHRDMLQLLQFLEPRSPFTEDDVLCSITNGVTADETVNVDQAQMVGTSVINALAGQEVHAFSFKKKDKAITLLTKLSVKCDNEDVHVDPQLLFQRLVSSAARGTVSGDELEQLFTYELCTHPPALFTMDGLLREANKPPLADAIEHAVGHTPCEIPSHVKYVLDGGSLLYRIPWQRGFSYNGLCTMYIDHVLHKYGTGATVIFDGYTGEPSTKDTTHLRRSKGQIGKTVKFTGNMILNANKKTFLGNATNKQRFIEMLSEKMVARSITTKHAKGDADRLFVQTAVCDASESPVVVVGEDTDLLVLLCYHAKTQRSNIYLQSEIRQNKKNAGRVWDITSTKERLGADVCHNILFLHAILGCDTTSRVFGLGKGLSLKRFQADSKFRKQAAVFDQKSATQQTIAAAGERALVSLYNGEDSETLDMLRQSRFFQKVGSSSKVVGPENIPPTSAAAKYHSFRVYHQVQEWQGRDDMQADEWGWIVKNGTMVGTQTDKPPAPGHLLNVIRCKCKTDCHTTRCSCKKHGLECSAMCGECKRVSCLNSPEVSLSIRDEDYLDT